MNVCNFIVIQFYSLTILEIYFALNFGLQKGATLQNVRKEIVKPSFVMEETDSEILNDLETK